MTQYLSGERPLASWDLGVTTVRSLDAGRVSTELNNSSLSQFPVGKCPEVHTLMSLTG